MKAALSHAAYAKFVNSRGAMRVGVASPPAAPARPELPTLVEPKLVPSPKTCELGMSAAMIHNVAHIELNAIDLAWDTVARFSRLAADDGTAGMTPAQLSRRSFSPIRAESRTTSPGTWAGACSVSGRWA